MVTLFGALFVEILDFLFVDVLAAPTEDFIEFKIAPNVPDTSSKQTNTTMETRIVSPRLSKIHSLATLAVQRGSFQSDKRTHLASPSSNIEEIRKADLSDTSNRKEMKCMKGDDLYECLLLDIQNQRERLKKGAERDLFDSSWG